MGTATRATPTYHVLLIGIDAYPSKPLDGCVHDIDAVQRVLLGDRVGLSRDRIQRLASPRPGAVHDTAVPSQPATLANLRARLAALGSDAVSPGDRVFIYYAGHGSRAAVITATGHAVHREALVPVDAYRERADPGLLFDFELTALLAAITTRTRNVTIILDCCHCAGATRHGAEATAQRARFHALSGDPDWRAALPDPERAEIGGHTLSRGLGGCHVIAACLAHERAHEELRDGVTHGLLTRALIHALHGAAGDLHAVSWRQIWQAMRAEVEDRSPRQHLWMAGNPARGVLAGPPLDGDPGLSVTRTDATYRVAAGTLAGVTPGAVIAIYGDRPSHFPRLDSHADHRARAGGLLRVTGADRAAATAEAQGAAFELPPGARGRLVALGAAERLRCALVPDHDALAAQLGASPLLELVEPSRAQVQLTRAGDHWVLTDDVHGALAGEPPLFAVAPEALGRVRLLLEHYHAYALPLRMAACATDLPGGLELGVLACPDRAIPWAEAQTADWPELATRSSATYELRAGARICLQVRNTSTERLRVTVVCSASSGKVLLLGDQVIDARTAYVFWNQGQRGAPFTMTLPPAKRRGVDRLVAIGRTAMAKDLGYLRTDQTFDRIAHAAGSANDVEDSAPHKVAPPPEQWTAAQVILDTHTDPHP
jgi:caspase domain-containing protein